MVCNAEMRGLRNAYPDIQRAGADLVAISVDPPPTNRAFVESARLPFALLSDANRELIGKLGLLHERGSPSGSDISVPATYVLDRNGTIVWMHRSPDVRTRPDPAEVLAVVKSLQ